MFYNVSVPHHSESSTFEQQEHHLQRQNRIQHNDTYLTVIIFDSQLSKVAFYFQQKFRKSLGNTRKSYLKLKQHIIRDINQNFEKLIVKRIKQNEFDCIQPSLLIKAIDILGLKDFLVDKLIFSRKKPSYRINQIGQKCKFNFSKTQFREIPGYTQSFSIIDHKDSFIPVVRFQYQGNSFYCQYLEHIRSENLTDCKVEKPLDQMTIIYSHGNSSDIEDSYNFISSIALKYRCDFIIYDYTGYTNDVGEPVNFKSKEHKLDQKSICQDLKKVIEWSQIPQKQIVLWGFSLGCFPTLSVTSVFTQINGLILQSPFASIYRLMSDEVAYLKKFKNDIFCNIDLIENVQSNILIMHSQDDEIIPYWHAQSLLKMCQFKGKAKFIKLLQLKKFGHNNLDQAFYTQKSNKLQEYIQIFLNRCMLDLRISGQGQRNFYDRNNRHNTNKKQQKTLTVQKLQFKKQTSIYMDSSQLYKQGKKLKENSVFPICFYPKAEKILTRAQKFLQSKETLSKLLIHQIIFEFPIDLHNSTD